MKTLRLLSLVYLFLLASGHAQETVRNLDAVDVSLHRSVESIAPVSHSPDTLRLFTHWASPISSPANSSRWNSPGEKPLATTFFQAGQYWTAPLIESALPANPRLMLSRPFHPLVVPVLPPDRGFLNSSFFRRFSYRRKAKPKAPPRPLYRPVSPFGQ